MNHEILRSSTAVEEFFNDFSEEFSFDTETTSLKYDELELVGISFSDGLRSCYIPVGHKYELGGTLVKEQVNLDWLLEYLREKVFNDKKKVIAHNITYDYKVLYKHGIDLFNHKWFDTMVADHLLDENKRHGLKQLVVDTFGDDYGIDTKKIQYMSVEEAGEYACKDAYYTYKLYETMLPRLLDEGLDKLFFKVEMPFLRAVAQMEIEGVLVDWEKVRSIKKELDTKIPELEEQLYLSLGEPYEIQMNIYGETEAIKGRYNFNSPLQLKKILTERLGLELTETTDSGNLSTGKGVLEDFKEVPFVDTLIKFKVANKLRSAFFEPMEGFKESDDRVRCSFHDTGTKTGRLSCSNPNLQQLPKANDAFPVETRGCFVVPEGYKMITCDYSGQELRVLAHITDCKPMIKAFKEGADFHQATADEFGVSRTKAKAINFGIAYGKSAYGFAKDWKVTEDEAQSFLDAYFDKFPEVKKAINKAEQEVKSKGYVKSHTGRKRRFSKNGQGYYSNGSFRQAFNFLIQGFSADMIRIAAIKCLNLINRNPSWGLKMLFTVHDECCFHVKEEYAEVAGEAIKHAFETAVKLKVPIVADMSIGNNYAEVK